MLSIAEMFAGEGSVISLDELLPKSFDLEEKVGSLPVEIELTGAPLRGLSIYFWIDAWKKEASSCLGIIQVMEDGHGFLLRKSKTIGLNPSLLLCLPQ